VCNFLKNKSLLQELTKNALAFTTGQKGASEKMAKIITKTLTI